MSAGPGATAARASAMFRPRRYPPSRLGVLRSQFRRSRGYRWRSSVLYWSVRTMLNRVAFAAISAAFIAAIPARALAQAGPAELVVRMDRLENQIRQLTGQVEQMQYRNQQLEAALRRLQDDNSGPRSLGAPLGAPPGAAPPNQPGMPGGRRSDAFEPVENPGAPGAPRVLGSVPPQPPTSMSRHSDAFDPMENPNAPGAPRVLGSIPPQPAPIVSPQRGIGEEPAPYGATAAAGAAVDPGSGRFPAGAGPRNPGPVDPYAVATAPPSSPRNALDLGRGYLQRRDYSLAEETFRGFLAKYPSDRLAAEAQFGLGESLFQLQNYQEAANAFVALSKKYETSPKAPEALLRLGQSLAAMNERELACVAFGDVGRKYPRVQPTVKQAIEREQKRARC
jgi:tol-pal system protein YbgF